METPCSVWKGAKSDSGYGWGLFSGQWTLAHRGTYEAAHGPIPEGMELDHLCRNTLCVNDDHLEPVTHRENQMRGDTFTARNAARTECPKGHPLSGPNLYVSSRGYRGCRECRNEASRAYKRRKQAV